MKLDEVTHAVIQDLEIGSETPIEDNFCKYCKGTDLTLIIRLKAVPNASLAGVQRKVSARKIAVLRCNSCKHESEGK